MSGRYTCMVVEKPGTRTSYLLQPMFNAWAGTAGLTLFPGTVYLCSDEPVQMPEAYLSLQAFEHLYLAPHQRARGGYSPRLYPVSISRALLAWVLRWSADDPELGFRGNHGGCEAERLLEVIAPVAIRGTSGRARLVLDLLEDSP